METRHRHCLSGRSNKPSNTIRRYNAHTNEGTDRRGTAILVKESITITDIKRIPSGRGMAAKLNGTWIVNIYAPSGAEKKNERENFYNTDLTYILTTTQAEIILAGDFNCTLTKTYSTGTNNYSRALANIVNGLGLIDAWDISTTHRMYTHYTATGATRID
jgi:exonuclease III